MKTILRKITGLFALALMLMSLALNASAQEGKNPLSGGTYTNKLFQFSIDFPQGWIIEHDKFPYKENSNIISFIDSEYMDANFSATPRIAVYPINVSGGRPAVPDDDHHNPLLKSSEILLDGKKALRTEYKQHNGDIWVWIELRDNLPSSWGEGAFLHIIAKDEEQMKTFDRMLESFKFLEDENENEKNWQTYSGEKFSHQCPGDWELWESKNYGGQVKVSDCSKVYSGDHDFIDGVFVNFSFVPQSIADTYEGAGENHAELLWNSVKNQPNAEPYENNNFEGLISMKINGHTLNLIARYPVEGGFYEVSALAMGDTKTDEEFKQMVDEIIATFEAK